MRSHFNDNMNDHAKKNFQTWAKYHNRALAPAVWTCSSFRFRAIKSCYFVTVKWNYWSLKNPSFKVSKFVLTYGGKWKQFQDNCDSWVEANVSWMERKQAKRQGVIKENAVNLKGSVLSVSASFNFSAGFSSSSFLCHFFFCRRMRGANHELPSCIIHSYKSRFCEGVYPPPFFLLP